ncbi:MAG: gamma-glutamylcyclotransferase [Halioglobus sp.]
MTETEQDNSAWVFGYGSLIYKVDFPVLESHVASIQGWQRRFWQGSHDHRGTPESPGRVVTLISSPDSICKGVAYRVSHDVFEHLDHREKNGYERVPVNITLTKAGDRVDGITYRAAQDNHAFLGPAPMSELAAHISRSRGPSGSNTDYLLQLADALREIGEQDEHIFALEALLNR